MPAAPSALHASAAAEGSAVAALLRLEDVRCAIDGNEVVRGVSLTLAPAQLGCLLGPSGCGKTTLLRAIAGFQALQGGAIALRGETASTSSQRWPPERRRLGFVFQDLALFPHLSVADNVGFGLQRVPREQRAQRIAGMLDLLGLDGLGKRFPHELSGGQQQRVALARSLAPQPDLLLLDEPFSSLDAHLRASLRAELVILLRRLGIAAVLVTHDQSEAFSFADRIGVMREGRLEQWDSAFDVYHRPATPFVARFVGEGRLIAGCIRSDGGIDTALGVQRSASLSPRPAGTRVNVLVRPDDLLPDGERGVEVRVTGVAFRGAETLYTLVLEDGSEVCALFPSHVQHVAGELIRVAVDLEHLVVFPATA
jgi:iron(III) transport system ATP-binding protein